ncbi:MAG TPA: maleylacetoacetate isomerase [Hyphomicrobiaceae bacterium]|nr:maleylacetoacetate isomerase [Hyphomicrobiaceae bacterium]
MKLYTYWRSLATFRVRIALNLKGLSYESVYVDLDAGDQKRPEFKTVNPQMVIPALVEDDGNILFQSLAILEYLNEIHPEPPLLPSDPRARARVRALALIAVADSHPLIVPRVRNHLAATLNVEEEGRLAWVRHWFTAGLDAYEGHLARDKATGTYAHGEQVTMADICLVSHAIGHQVFKGTLEAYPTVKRIVETCMSDERFAKAQPRRQPGAPQMH